MKNALLAIVSSFIPLLVLDVVWLTTMSKRFYQPLLQHLMAPKVNFIPAAVFYVLYAVGVGMLVVLPAFVGSSSYTKVLLTGMLLGLVAYGAYDFTNQATLKNWPVVVTVVDLVWGMVLTGVSSVVGLYILRMLVLKVN